MADIIDFASLVFQLVVLAIVGGIAIWGSLKLTRHVSASRRATEMKQEALVIVARQRAQQRAPQRLA